LNHFAAEVHQNTAVGSSDIDWGAEIFASVGSPKLTITREGANVRIRWRPAAGTLQHTDNMSDNPVWTAQGTGAANGEVGPGEYVIPATLAHRFYTVSP
jgi:hypothetical protein